MVLAEISDLKSSGDRGEFSDLHSILDRAAAAQANNSDATDIMGWAEKIAREHFFD